MQFRCELKLDFTLRARSQTPHGSRTTSSELSPFKMDSYNYTNLGSPLKRGKALHEKRRLDLEIEEYERILISNAEERFVLSILSLYKKLTDLSQKGIVRGVPIYGRIGNMILAGEIDELRYDRNTNTVIVSELKSRSINRLPEPKEQVENKIQVALYTYLLKNLRNIDIDFIIAMGPPVDVEVDGNKAIREDILRYCPSGVTTPNELLALIKDLPQFEVSSLEVEYVFVEDATLIEVPIEKQENVVYDENSLLTLIAYFEELWFWKRDPAPEQAVHNIEDLWKCNSCDFKHRCNWTRRISTSNRAYQDENPNARPLPSTSHSAVRNLNPEFQ